MHVGSAKAATISLDEHSAEDLVRDHDVTGIIIDNDASILGRPLSTAMRLMKLHRLRMGSLASDGHRHLDVQEI